MVERKNWCSEGCPAIPLSTPLCLCIVLHVCMYLKKKRRHNWMTGSPDNVGSFHLILSNWLTNQRTDTQEGSLGSYNSNDQMNCFCPCVRLPPPPLTLIMYTYVYSILNDWRDKIKVILFNNSQNAKLYKTDGGLFPYPLRLLYIIHIRNNITAIRE